MFIGLGLVFVLIILGIQVWYAVGLKIEGEIGGLRFAVLLLLTVFSLLVVANSFFGDAKVPPLIFAVFLLLPLIFLRASQYWEKKQGEELEVAEIHAEIGKWEHTIQKDPEHTGAYIRMGELHLRLGEKDKALAHYKKALSLRPGDPGVLEQIRFIEKKMEMVPKLSRSDLGVVKTEFKKIPLVFGLVLAAILGIIFIIYLLCVLPAPVVFVVVVIVPVILFFRWIMKL
ncbi:MAG: tetratricopeptide repeat protein [Candidatus Omnitrophota bacterium]